MNRKITSKKLSAVICAVLMILGMSVGMGASTVYAAEVTEATAVSTTDNKKLQNGSFEEGQTFTKDYSQPDQSAVPYWNTTAFEKKIELFRKNTGTYIGGVILEPTDGTYAAELNADEESTLYQTVNTTPSSIYEWGLDHGGRTTMDNMALIIGPAQKDKDGNAVNPSKPSKAGRDQFMQMVDWLIDNNIADARTEKGISDKKIVYSKKFGANGTFQDNAGNNAFSLTPSTIYTEEWHIWIIADGRQTSGSGDNPWGSYGSNAEGSAGSNNSSGSTTVDLSKYYLYTVPAGQEKTLFSFVSVKCEENKGTTFGNFLDGINFQLYHPLSSSTSNHGSAVIGGSGGDTGGTGSNNGHEVTIDKQLATYVTHGSSLQIQAVVKKADANDGCEFVGIYKITHDDSGKLVSEFMRLAGNVIEDTGSLTEEQKTGKWVKTTNNVGDIIYTYYIKNMTSATDIHFIFIKSPTLTYDPNGGKPYVVERTYNTEEAKNVYSFKPAAGHNEANAETGTIFIDPYVSHAAEGQNDGWKFIGWKLTGDEVDKVDNTGGYHLVNPDTLNSLILDAVHTVACDYSLSGVNGDTKAQYFKIYSGKMFDNSDGNENLQKSIKKNENNESVGVTWQDQDKGKGIIYANIHKGITMIAQWRWRQAFIPQVDSGSSYTDSDKGGTVEITSVNINNKDQADNYDANYNEGKGGKSYHAETGETIHAQATAKDDYIFEGWYDAKGNLLTTNNTYGYVEKKEGVNTYYARFSPKNKVYFARKVNSESGYKDTDDDNIAKLDRYEYADALGTTGSSTAMEGENHKFVGWYDAKGNEVGKNATYSVTISEQNKLSTFYAYFDKAYTVKFVAQTKQSDGSFKTDTDGGKVSVASVKDFNGKPASSEATANAGYKFLGWYDKDGNRLSTDATYSTTTTNNVTYYARFENVVRVTGGPYLSFVAESESTQIPSQFNGRHAGTGKNISVYGLDNEYGNTISTGFKYYLGDTTGVKTIQITVSVPKEAYVKVGGTGKFKGNGTNILTDSDGVRYNKGSIQQISGATTLTYYWDATGLTPNTEYGFVIDNLYAPGAKATITFNSPSGTPVTSDNGVVNKPSNDYKAHSKYKKK